jgi:hypothetical protein
MVVPLSMAKTLKSLMIAQFVAHKRCLDCGLFSGILRTSRLDGGETGAPVGEPL